MRSTETVTRAKFIKNLMHSGLDYSQSNLAYEAMVLTFQDAIVLGHKINIGQVCSITPQRMPPRTVCMHFKKVPGGGIIKQKREYTLGSRIRYKVKLFPSFIKSHELLWFE